MDLNSDVMSYVQHVVLVAAIVGIIVNHYWKSRSPPSKASPQVPKEEPASPAARPQRTVKVPLPGSQEAKDKIQETKEAKSSPTLDAKAPATRQPPSASAQAAVSTPSPNSNDRYEGTVKRYSVRNGMGFVTCSECKERYNVDVRIFKEEYEGLKLEVGDAVTFSIDLGGRQGCPKAQPWATDVEKSLATSEGTKSAQPAPEEAREAGGWKHQPVQAAPPAPHLNTSAPEFVPAMPQLNAAAPEFVPGEGMATGVAAASEAMQRKAFEANSD